MTEPSGIERARDVPQTSDTRFDHKLVERVAQALTLVGYVAPADPVDRQRAYEEFVFILGLLVSAFEGKTTVDVTPNPAVIEVQRAAEKVMRAQAIVDGLTDVTNRGDVQ